MVVADDEVIEHADVDEGECIAEPPRDQFVGLTRLRYAGRVVVRKDERGRVVLQRLPYDFARMNTGAVDGAAEHFFEMNEPVAVIEMQAAEHLVGPVTQLRGEELSRGGGRVQRG